MKHYEAYSQLIDAELEAINQITAECIKLMDEFPNPGDVGRQMFSPEEYAQLMAETEAGPFPPYNIDETIPDGDE